MPDKTLRCVECGEDFEFAEGEQAFYKKKDLSEPKRCKECRAAKRANREAGEQVDNARTLKEHYR